MNPVNKDGVLSVKALGNTIFGRTIGLGNYASSPEGRCELRMQNNGNLEWGMWLLSLTSKTSIEAKYTIRAASNTGFGEKEADRLQYYAWYGPRGVRGGGPGGGYPRPEPPRHGPVKLQVRSRKLRHGVGTIGTADPNVGGWNLLLQDDGNLISQSKTGLISWTIGPVAAAQQPKMGIPAVGTLVIGTPGVTIDGKGSRRIENDGSAPAAVFDGQKVHVLQGGDEIRFSHTGALEIFQVVVPRDYSGTSSADATKQDIRDIPASSKVIRLSSFATSLALQ